MLHQAIVPPAIAVVMNVVQSQQPANEGAYRLAWWLKDRRNLVASAARVAMLCGQQPAWLERVVIGEIVPDEDAAENIAIATIGAVLPADWGRWAVRPWHVEPSRRVAPQPRVVQ